jgi:cyclopropane fatty-acyl-phospholipid synthase-like methyltransferase
MEPRAVDRLRKRAVRAGVADRIHARACDPRDMGLSTHAGTVDVILVIHTLHEFEDLPGFLRQARELLAPEGKVWVVEPRGHVTEAAFRTELAVCLTSGFREARPASVGKHMTVLLERDLP